MKRFLKLIIVPAVSLLYLQGCTPVNVYEKNVPIKNHQWQSSFRPSVRFTISDTLSLYNLYVVIRHSDAYDYNNIWMAVYTTSPGGGVQKQPLDLQLADNRTGWLGTGMDDIYEHRIRITNAPVQLKKAGEYVFTFEQTMREDPLLHVLNVGLRVEKV